LVGILYPIFRAIDFTLSYKNWQLAKEANISRGMPERTTSRHVSVTIAIYG